MRGHLHRHKEKYTGALLLLGGQIVIGGLTLFLFMHNYDQITVGEGTVAAFQPEPVVVKSYTVQEKVQKTDTQIAYEGVFGRIKFGEKREPGDSFHNKRINFTDIDLNPDAIKRFLHLESLFQQKVIDGHMFHYLMQASNQQYQTILSHRKTLEAYSGRALVIPETEWFDTKLEEYEKLAQEWAYEKLVHLLSEHENKLQHYLHNSTSQLLSANFVQSKEFTYLWDKLHIDERKMYAEALNKASEVFDLNPNLIKATIMTEQIRWFFTYRWVMKQIIASQKYMMVMKQSSRGIGGIKEKTAKKIESFIEKNYPDLFSVYFSKNGQAWTTQDRYNRLIDTKHYDHQIMYVAANLAMNRDLWAKEWFSIKEEPGVLLTLYNIWTRTPHKDPEIGGSSLYISGQKFSFGSLGMMLYYLLEVYW